MDYDFSTRADRSLDEFSIPTYVGQKLWLKTVQYKKVLDSLIQIKESKKLFLKSLIRASES